MGSTIATLIANVFTIVRRQRYDWMLPSNAMSLCSWQYLCVKFRKQEGSFL